MTILVTTEFSSGDIADSSGDTLYTYERKDIWQWPHTSYVLHFVIWQTIMLSQTFKPSWWLVGLTDVSAVLKESDLLQQHSPQPPPEHRETHTAHCPLQLYHHTCRMCSPVSYPYRDEGWPQERRWMSHVFQSSWRIQISEVLILVEINAYYRRKWSKLDNPQKMLQKDINNNNCNMCHRRISHEDVQGYTPKYTWLARYWHTKR